MTNMPRIYKTREDVKKRVPIDEKIMRSAVADVIAGASIRGTAKSYGLAVMTLKRYARKRKNATTKQIDYTPNYRHSQIFSITEESELVNYLMKASKLYHGLTAKNVRQLAFQYATENKKQRMIDGGPPGTEGAPHPSGWMTCQTFCFFEIFPKACKMQQE
ncbi:hypothetical protein WA026_016255 [Henosepilachna vigintioctopunctata]|uniref:HTH psq-type domain-containing protein n=1 Tax=Henosepilachna vigintioctopunctata TaxID=420089 RepID=A0AAW1TLG4_9CUCU